MKVNRKVLAAGAAVAVLGVGAGGIAYAAGGGSEEPVSGPSAEKAKSAALKAAGGGTVLEVERQDGDGGGVFEVEVQRDDGSQVEIHLDGQYQLVGTAPDDDNGSDSDDEAGEGAGDN